MFKLAGIQKRAAVAILGTALLAFVAGGVGTLLFQERSLRVRAEQRLQPYAEMIAVSAATAVRTANRDRAQEILNSLQADPLILRAEILLPDDRTLAKFPAASPLLDPRAWHRLDGVFSAGPNAVELVRALPVSGGRPAHLYLRASLTPIRPSNLRLLGELALAVAGVLLVIGFTQMFLLRRWVLQPLAQLAAVAENARKRGDYSLQMPAHTNDEFGRLGRSFNSLLTMVQYREAALRHVTSFQSAILNDAAYAIISTTTEGRITSFNPAAEKLLGYSAEELIGTATPALFHDPGELAARAREFAAQLGEPVAAGFEVMVARSRRDLPNEFEWTYLHKDGRTFPVLLSVSALRDDHGAVNGFLGMAVDITDRKQFEQRLRQNNALLEATLHATADGILVVAADGTLTSHNRQLEDIWPVPAGILQSGAAGALTEYLVRQMKDPAAAARSLIPFHDRSNADTFEMLEFADGRSFERYSRPQLVDDKVVGRVWSFRDVTAARRAEVALRESEYKFKMLFETANDTIFLMNRETFLECNFRSEQMFGCPRKKLIGASPADFSPERQASGEFSRVQAAAKIAGVLAGAPQFFEWIHCRADGTPFNAEVSLNRLELHGQVVIQAIVRDITARKQSEAALRDAEELYRTLVNTSPDGICVLNTEGRVTFISPKDIELFRLPEAQAMLGRPMVDCIVEADRARATLVLRDLLRGRLTAEQRLVMRRADGTRFVAELNGAPLRDGQGRPRGVMFLVRDVTERQRQEDELKSKNGELERFTYTVSHDLKSPLITIKGFAGALLKDFAGGRTHRLNDDLKRIIAAADKMSELLNGLLELSRVGRIVNAPVPVAMSQLAAEVVELLAGSIAERQASVTVQPDLPPAHGDPQRLREVLQNLVENALKFSVAGQTPEIEIGSTAIGGETRYFVRDHGQGLEARYFETIFGLFNKLDARSAGTGIGLALVRRIIEFHGGKIWVESAGPGWGATFYFTLPAQTALCVGAGGAEPGSGEVPDPGRQTPDPKKT